MPLRKFEVILHSHTGLPRDDAVNVLYYEIDGSDTIVQVSNDIHTAYANAGALFASTVVSMTIKVYGMVPGPPLLSTNYAIATGGTAAPAEVALCLSYAGTTIPQAAPRTQKGRIYLGPINGADERPGSVRMNNVVALGQELAAAGTAGSTVWHVHSAKLGTSVPIQSVWCDDSWDTQRRRGLAPTSRVVQVV